MKDGLISIIVPMYNREKHIEECIDSILTQTYKNIEILLIDDGSTDGTVDKVKQYVEKYSNIRYIFQNNQGVSVARNTGIKEALGEFIMFVDSDDKILPTICEDLISKDSDVVLCRYKKFPREEVESLDYSILENLNNIECISKGELRFMYENIMFNPPVCKLYKKNLIDTYFDKSLSIGEDIVFNFKYLKNCKSIAFVNKELYLYRQGEETSLSNKYDKNRIDMVHKVYEETNIDSKTIFKHTHIENMFKTTFLREACLSMKKMLVNRELSYKEKYDNLKIYKDKYSFSDFETEDWQGQAKGYKIFYSLYKRNLFSLLIILTSIIGNVSLLKNKLR